VNVSSGSGITSGSAPVPHMAVEPNGGVDVVWGQNGAYFRRFSNGTFSNLVPLTTSVMASQSPRIAINSSGHVFVVWENAGSCPTITFARSTNGGANFTNYSVADDLTVNGQPVTGCTSDVQIALGANNTIWLLWANENQNIRDLIITYAVDNDPFTQPPSTSFPETYFENLSTTASYTPKMAIDGAGHMDMVWIGDYQQNGGPHAVYFNRSTNPQDPASFCGGADSPCTTPPILTNPPALGLATRFPQIAVEPSGAIDIIWQQASAANPSGAYDIVLARSTDGVNFTKTTLNNVPTTQGGTGQNAVDTSGNVYAVWQGSVGGGGDVLLNGNSAGLIASVQFSLNGVKVSAAPPSAVIDVGGAASFALTASSTNSVVGSFTLTCGGAPAGVNCNFSPNPVSLTPNGSASVTLSVSVSAKPAGSMAEPGPGDSTRYRPDRLPAIPVATLGVGFAAFLAALIAGYKKNARRFVSTLALVILLAVLTTGMISCGGSTHGGGGGSITFPLTLMAHSNSGSASMGSISITVP